MSEATAMPPEEPSVIEPTVTKSRLVLILGALVVILVISNVWVYTNFTGQVDTLTTEKADLQLQVTDLTEIANLGKSMIVNQVNNLTVGQGANSYTSWMFLAGYAGYLEVNVHESDTHDTYVRVRYIAYGVVYERLESVGTGKIAVFPILPSNIEIQVGNTNPSDDAHERLTITYHY